MNGTRVECKECGKLLAKDTQDGIEVRIGDRLVQVPDGEVILECPVDHLRRAVSHTAIPIDLSQCTG